jgi:hydrogenase/urease accessory protein HupE
VLLMLGTVCVTAHAHEVRPGFLEIRALAEDTFDVLWKVPANGDYRLAMYVKLPAKCDGAPSSGTFTGGAFVERWRATCPGGLVGERVAIDGLSATRTDVLARFVREDATTQTVRLTPEDTSFEVTAEPNAWQVARTYLLLGIEHILLGVDHLLFVLGLLFLVSSWRRLVATVTAFTLAHSITLAAATLGWVNVPQTPIEAAIALSVMFVAAEIIHQANGRPGLTARSPWVVAFIFGLLHGFGFAGALREVGLPQSDIPIALLFFNVGVEVGQLLFIAAVVTVLGLASRLMGKDVEGERGPWRAEALIRTPVAYVVGSTAAFWVVQRVVAFWA